MSEPVVNRWIHEEMVGKLKERIAELEAQVISSQKLELMPEDDLRHRLMELEDMVRGWQQSDERENKNLKIELGHRVSLRAYQEQEERTLEALSERDELEAQLEKSKEVQSELGQMIKKKDQRTAELEDNNDELRETLTKWKELLREQKQRIAELEALLAREY